MIKTVEDKRNKSETFDSEYVLVSMPWRMKEKALLIFLSRKEQGKGSQEWENGCPGPHTGS